MKTSVIPLRLCPYCGYPHDRATDVHGRAKPKAGDLSVCLNCGEISQYGASLELAKVSNIELPPIDQKFVDYIKQRGPFHRPGVKH